MLPPVKIRLVWLLALVACVAARGSLDPAKAPGSNFDLSHWKLSLPVNDAGDTTGKATEISTAKLTGGYSNPPFFRTGNDGAMVFECPAEGAIVAGMRGPNAHPRTELRELLNPSDSKVNWTGEGVHMLSARCRVNAVAAGGKVCIGQIHGRIIDVPLLMIFYDNTTSPARVTANLKYRVDKAKVRGSSDHRFQFANVELGADMDYTILVTNGSVAVTVNGVTQSQGFYANDARWKDVDLYFKAGAYYTANGGKTTAAQVAFYTLVSSHPDGNDRKVPPASSAH
jgi:hypothetical protein